MWQKCPICNGSGSTIEYVSCTTCNGKKIISELSGLPPNYEQNIKELKIQVMNISNKINSDFRDRII